MAGLAHGAAVVMLRWSAGGRWNEGDKPPSISSLHRLQHCLQLLPAQVGSPETGQGSYRLRRRNSSCTSAVTCSVTRKRALVTGLRNRPPEKLVRAKAQSSWVAGTHLGHSAA
ncbi:hypothetical protein AAFF_G00016820 [Aldrovandia affinis]|uniref:Uncharacterized protein n=1 Tax=Aldrovandia affinis TaxID=143900 RepID=A0AAD7S601_9TELE|nr:hypothetical protein AAFF_G00016820 [Aldrovandia affinis]